MKVSYDVQIEESKRVGRESEESKMIRMFLDGSQSNMCFEYDTDEEAKQKAGLISQIVKRINKEGKVVDYTKRNNKVYVLKITA